MQVANGSAISENIVDSPRSEEAGKRIHFSVDAPSGVGKTDPARVHTWSPDTDDMTSVAYDSPGFDMDNRDPNNINSHLQLMWDDLVAEPEGIRSYDWIWKSSYHVFRCSMDCCYGFLTILCSLPIALCIGLNFGCLAFQHVWCVGPCYREWKLKCHVVKNFFRVTLSSICGPCCETCGLVLSQIRILRYQTQTTKGRIQEDV